MDTQTIDVIEKEANNLLHLLIDQANKYKKLILLSKKQASFLVDGERLKINELAEQSEELVGQIRNISKRSDKLVANMAVKLGLNKESSYIAVINKLNSCNGELKQSLRSIAKLISELAPENYKNALLIKQGLDIENFKLNAIKNKVSTENIYSINGKLNKKDGFLLDKQV